MSSIESKINPHNKVNKYRNFIFCRIYKDKYNKDLL